MGNLEEASLIAAARAGNIDAVRASIASGAPLDETGHAGGSAVCWAAAEGHADVVDVLLAAGANRYVAGGPGRWAYRSANGIQWDVLSVTRADPELNDLWRTGGLPIERRDNYTMTELKVTDSPSRSARLIAAGHRLGPTELTAAVREAVDDPGAPRVGPAVACYSHFTAGFSSQFEAGETCSVAVLVLDDAGESVLAPIRVARVFVKGPITQLGFAHYSLRYAASEAGLTDPGREIREIFHYYEAWDSDGNVTELQVRLDG